MIIVLALIGVIIGVVGAVTGIISTGVIFLISLAVFLYMLFSMMNRKVIWTDYGIALMVISFMLLLYSTCVLFFGIDVKAVLGL